MKRLFWPAILGLLLVSCILCAPPPTFPVETILTAVATPTSAATATPTVTPTPASLAGGWSWDDLTPYKQAMLPDFATDVDRFADATRYMIDLRVDLKALTFGGEEHVRYQNHETEPLTEIVFRLLPNTPGYGGAMQVRSVAVNGEEAAFDLRFQGSAVYVPLASPLLPGRMIELSLAFDGTLPNDASAGYAQFGHFEDVLAMPNAYPMIPVYDDEGWNVELAPTYGDATFSDTSLYLVRVTLPDGMYVATSGVIVDRWSNDDGTVTYACASGPMRDFNIVASTRYRTLTTTVGSVLITSYYLPEYQGGGSRALDYASYALRLYEQLFGPYPFTELDVVATPTEAGGIEYPGLIVIAERLSGQEGGFFELATVHETAHQWWYSMVGNDQLDEPWLDEALTQYSALLYYEHRYGQERARSLLKDSFEGWYKSVDEDDQKMGIGLPVASYPEHLYGPIVYGKGPLFFHEMRQQVGDEAFYEILRTYWNEHLYGVAYPRDLMIIAEQVSGQDLDALYEQWILGQ